MSDSLIIAILTVMFIGVLWICKVQEKQWRQLVKEMEKTKMLLKHISERNDQLEQKLAQQKRKDGHEEEI